MISETLDLGLDSFVFIDDNPVERELIRNKLPMVSVPEMPEDPSLYRNTINGHHYFETAGVSDEDKNRSRMYKENLARRDASTRVLNIDDFLGDLEMKAIAGPITDAEVARSAQLINKSNQFHLTTKRYSDVEVNAFLASPDWRCYYFRLSDRFGDHGLISVVLIRIIDSEWAIDTWVMSCRVLSRTMEEYILDFLLNQAKNAGISSLQGKYIPSGRNELVREVYPRLGFQSAGANKEETLWKLAVDSHLIINTFVGHSPKQKFEEQ